MDETDTPTDTLILNGQKIEVYAVCYGSTERGNSPAGGSWEASWKGYDNELNLEKRGRKHIPG